MSADPLIKKHKNGWFYLRVPRPGFRRWKWVATGARDITTARAIVAESGADRLVHLALARTLTAETLNMVLSGQRRTCAEVVAGWAEWLENRAAPVTRKFYGEQVGRLVEFCGGKDVMISAGGGAQSISLGERQGLRDGQSVCPGRGGQAHHVGRAARRAAHGADHGRRIPEDHRVDAGRVFARRNDPVMVRRRAAG